MLINIKGRWFDSELVQVVFPAQDSSGHSCAYMIHNENEYQIHSDDNEDLTPGEFAAKLAEQVNLANNAFEITDTREFSLPDFPGQQDDAVADELNETWFRSGWDAFAKDIIGDFYRAVNYDSVVDQRWFELWLQDHGLRELAQEIRMDLAQEAAQLQAEKAALVEQSSAAPHQVQYDQPVPPPVHQHGTPDVTGFSAEALSPALRSDVRRLLATGGVGALSEAIAALVRDQRPEQD